VTTFAPRTADEVTEALRWALSAGEAFEVIGRGTKRALGRPVNVANVLDVSALSGIVSYEPAELVLTALAGTPMQVIEAALAEQKQCLAFEPPDFAALLGTSGTHSSTADASATAHAAASVARGPPGNAPPAPVLARSSSVSTRPSGTLGGLVATGLSGPRRFKAGAVRDHVLGIAAVSGRGEAFVAGGKVVKNVTGYDLPKLMTGSHGTLAVLTEITMKVLPAPEEARTLLVAGLDVNAAVREMTSVLQTPLDVTGACYLPARVAVPGKPSDAAVAAFRLEGFAVSVEFRAKELHDRLASLGVVSVLRDADCGAFWRAVRDVTPFAETRDDWVWRISVPPASASTVVARIESALSAAKWFLDCAGGLIWLAASAAPRSAAPTPIEAATNHSSAHLAATSYAAHIRQLLAEVGGHATLVRAPALVRATVEVFHPQAPALAALSNRVKAQFDPSRILNPGRMYPPA
jgi:glycolate oxidase FAD binding subunit